MGIRKNIINNMSPGKIFSLEDLGIQPQKKASACVVLSNMIAKKELERITNGMYYIPVNSKMFGKLPPEEKEIISFLCRKKKGYPSGFNVFNKMGLTEQVPNLIEIAFPDGKNEKKRICGTNICFRKAYTSPENKEILLLQILDAITYIKKIPARTLKESAHEIENKIKNLTKKQQKEIITYAKDYPPRTRYILYKILEKQGKHFEASSLKATINKTTKFNYGY